jgi:hypothetical protein
LPAVILTRIFMMALAVAAALCACGPPQKQSEICDGHRRGAVLVTSDVVVYGLQTASRSATTYYACTRPHGRPVQIGIDERGLFYGSDATTGGFGAAGSYVVAQSSTGEASLAVCARYNNTRRCTFAQHWFTVVNLKTGRQAHLPLYTSLSVPTIVPFPVMLALSPKGAVAWLQARTVDSRVTSTLQLWATRLAPRGRSTLAAASSVVDTGSIDPSSVRFDGLTLYWTRGRKPHRIELP